jgi:hypothetical protein
MPGKEHPGCPPMDTQHDERQTQMTDIVERLRRVAKELPQTSGNQAWLRPEDTTAWEAADEIEKLRAALIEINELNSKRLGYSKKIERVIWKALGEKE